MLLRKELKDNLKSFIIWTTIITLFTVMMIAAYPSFSDDIDAVNDMIKGLPEGLLKAFNMDKITFDTAIGYFATEGYMFVSILGGCFAAITASSIISKEESDKTAEFLLTKPITRNKVVTHKIITTLIYITSLNVIISLITLIGFNLINDFDFTKWLLISVGPLLLCYTFAAISFLLSCFIVKSRKVMTASLALVLGTYMLNIIAKLTDTLSFLKYLSPFEYVDANYLIIDEIIPLKYIIIMIVIITTCTALTYKLYNKKDIEI
jgi:ABC-2 type transport system permease protein